MNAHRPSASGLEAAETLHPSNSLAESSPDRSEVRARFEILGAFRLLLAAFNYARDSHIDPWQFAVEIDELRQRGAAYTDLRWLIGTGLAEHRRETTVPGDAERSYRPLVPTDFPPTTAVVLTERGAQRISGILPSERRRSRRRIRDAVSQAETQTLADPHPLTKQRPKPVWDQLRRELRFGDQVVKRFRVPAPNQELILQTFQEEDWPACIDDPLPPTQNQASKERLLATIKSLNRHQLSPSLEFHGNGNGLQVYWEPRNATAAVDA